MPWPRTRRSRPPATDRETGAFRVAGLPPARYRLRVGRGFEEQFLLGPFDLAFAQELDLGDVRVPPMEPVWLELRLPGSGAPAPSRAFVAADDGRQITMLDAVDGAPAGASWVRSTPISTGMLRVFLEGPGFRRLEQSIVHQRGGGPLRITLAPATTHEFTIVSEVPYARAGRVPVLLRVVDAEGVYWIWRGAEIAASQRAVLTHGLPEGRFTAEVVSVLGTTTRREMVVGPPGAPLQRIELKLR